MTEATHKRMVAALVKPGADILATMTPDRVNMLHMAVGISGEAGELIDAIKKVAVYNKPIDRVNVVEELGDLEFYMEGLRQALDISRQETLDANEQKLIGGENARYVDGKYTDAAAQARADKAT
jgi:NTP pyrophosphatase (non-canonical NTP hydrolase)